jgi:hypothetical protein
MGTCLALPYMLGNRCHFIFHKHVFVIFFFLCLIFQPKKKLKIGGEDAEFLYIFFLLIVFQILHVFLPDISVHCALIKYAYILLRVYA